ncbi:mitochondrial carrier family [Dorcoceras hygrometricum]|uniref:Mitochondrial carrier family n=1 Tax=Dorcoceras hygrometricum TaxID=472368 RepID=A0A2Z7A2U9_9LAMI|nr:mitochondrial carrier family [Dorcoceras hygrometricum]
MPLVVRWPCDWRDGGRPAVRHPWRAMSRGAPRLSRPCVAAARRCSGDIVTADFFLGFCLGLSRAAREIFGPIFDIGHVLVDFEI